MRITVAGLRDMLEPGVRTLGFELVEVEYKGAAGGQNVLRVYIDSPKGITVDDCARVSRQVSALLDVEDPIAEAYVLEVSSPGLDRTLSKPEHFIRFSGSAVNVKTFQQINGQKVFHGKLLGLAGDAVQMELETGVIIEIPMKNVAKASLRASL